MHVSHTTDNFTSRAVLFSGIEVKPENGDQKEAELQMGIWMAASFRRRWCWQGELFLELLYRKANLHLILESVMIQTRPKIPMSVQTTPPSQPSSNPPSLSSATSTKSTTPTHLLSLGTSRSSDRAKSLQICQRGLSRASSNLLAFMLPSWTMDIG